MDWLDTKDTQTTLLYKSQSRNEFVDVKSMHQQHLINMIIKLIAKECDGEFKVVRKKTTTEVDNYTVSANVH